MAGASCDDIFVIVLFTTFADMAQGWNARLLDFASIPVSILLGVVIGAAFGFGLSLLFERAYTRGHLIRNSVKTIIILGAAVDIRYTLSAGIAAVAMIFIVLAFRAAGVALLAGYPNLLVCGTFSKSRSLAGLRLGFAIGSAELISVLEAVKNSYNSYTVDNLSLLCGAAAMDDEAYFAKTTAAVITTRERVRRALEQMGFSVLPSRTNFLFATKDGASMRELFLYLKQRHIYIRYFDLPRIDNYVRITIGTDAQMDAFLQGTEAFLRGE